jgi:hypothetical protein
MRKVKTNNTLSALKTPKFYSNSYNEHNLYEVQLLEQIATQQYEIIALAVNLSRIWAHRDASNAQVTT